MTGAWRTVRAWFPVAGALAAMGLLLTLPAPAQPAPAAPRAAGSSAPAGPTLASVWRDAKPFPIPATFPDGSAYTPVVILDSTTSVGTVTRADGIHVDLAQVPATLRDDPWVAGILMIGDGLQRALERQGVERIAPCHAPFDPHLHEAVAHVEATDVAQDTVIQVYCAGYTYNGRVLRAAQVQVAVRKEQ